MSAKPSAPVVFGKRGLTGAPVVHASAGLPAAPAPHPRRLRTTAIVVGVAGVFALGAYALARGPKCDPEARQPNGEPMDCKTQGQGFFDNSGSHYGSGGYHSWGGSSGWGGPRSGGALAHGSSGSHASFGGFGGIGAGHGHGGGS